MYNLKHLFVYRDTEVVAVYIIIPSPGQQWGYLGYFNVAQEQNKGNVLLQ